MISWKRIVVPLDFSDFSQRALEYAIELGITFDSVLYLLHVVDDPVLNAAATRDAYREQVDRDIRPQLEALIPAADRGRCKYHLDIAHGAVGAAIVDVATKQHANLIVLGSHGRSQIADLLLGSAAEYVLHHAPCPVLTVPPPESRAKKR